MRYKARSGSQYLKQYQLDYLEENAATLTSKQLAFAVGCSQESVNRNCKKLKVTPLKPCFQLVHPVIPPCIAPQTITNE